MVTISRDSWHYKLMEQGREVFDISIPYNLCPYFWKLTFVLPLYMAVTTD